MSFKHYYLVLAITFCGIVSGYSQCSSVVKLNNASFEGTPGATPPPQWTSCHPGYDPTTEPGSCLSSAAYDGSTFMGLKYTSGQGAQGASQQLNVPLAAGVTYTSSIALASYEYGCGQKFDPNCAAIQIWGGFSSCDMNTQLWSSGTLPQWQSWHTYQISFTPSQNFTYITIVISGCSSTAFVGVDTIAPFNPNFSATAAVIRNNLCAHDSTGKAVVSAIGNIPNLTYQWSNTNPVQTDSILKNVPAGTYTVTVSGNNNALCATASVTITAPPPVTVSAAAVTNTCFTNGNGSATASAGGGVPPYTFHWNSSSGTGDHLSPGTYKVTAYDSYNCSASASVTIDSVAPLNITAFIKPAACPNFNNGRIDAIVSGGNGPYAYLWSAPTANTSISLYNDTLGSYTVTVTDAHHCTKAATFSVGATSPSDTITVISDASSCNGHTINGQMIANGSGGTPGFTYVWNTNPPQYTATAINVGPGTYTVTATDGAGCSVTSSATIVLSTGISVNVSSSNSSCGSSTGFAVATVSGANAPHYHWNTGATTDTLMGVSAGYYKVTVTNEHNCSATGAVTVNTTHSNDTVHITSVSSTTICSGDSAYICAPSGYSSYHWNNNIQDNSPCVYTQYAGNSYLTVTDQNGCTVESNHIYINVLPNPPVAISANGDTLKSYGAATYQWYHDDALIPGATDSQYVAPEPGTYSVYVTGDNGCHQKSIPYHYLTNGIVDVSAETWVKVYPNPSTSGAWQLQVGSNLIGSKVEVYDASGRMVYKSEIRSISSQLDLDVAKGVYLLQVISPNKNFNLKLTRL